MKPPKLKKGSLIGLAAPASPVPGAQAILRGQRALENLGFRVRRGRHLLDRRGYLAGRDEDRAEDLNELFSDPAVEGVFCVRGGYGAARLLGLVDFSSLKEHPKVFLGYSDITALHLAIWKEVGLVSFYGPMVTTEMAGRFLPDNRERMVAALTDPRPPEPIGASPDSQGSLVIHPGVASGTLVGGCLSILVTLLGTPWEPQLEGAILFLEDVDEEPYRLDRYLTQLRVAGKLDGLAGVAIGHLVNCEPRPGKPTFIRSFSSTKVLQDRLGDLGVPVVAGLGFGHGRYKATLPQGVMALLDADRGQLEMRESGVR